MDRVQLVTKWHKMRGAIKQEWGRLTDDDLDRMTGDYDLLISKIHELYGETREEIDRRLDDIARNHAA